MTGADEGPVDDEPRDELAGGHLYLDPSALTRQEIPLDDLPQYPDFDAAIEMKSTSFGQVAEAFFGSKPRFNSNPRTGTSYAAYYPKLVKSFIEG